MVIDILCANHEAIEMLFDDNEGIYYLLIYSVLRP